MKLTLRPVSASTYAITQGRKKVGFVNKCPAGYVARIGQHCETRGTARDAFDAVALKVLGHASVADLQAHNREVRARNAAARAEANAALSAAMQGSDFELLWNLIEKMSK